MSALFLLFWGFSFRGLLPGRPCALFFSSLSHSFPHVIDSIEYLWQATVYIYGYKYGVQGTRSLLAIGWIKGCGARRAEAPADISTFSIFCQRSIWYRDPSM